MSASKWTATCIAHALQGQFNQRKHMPGYAAWEITAR
jgi:hypothetical protein